MYLYTFILSVCLCVRFIYFCGQLDSSNVESSLVCIQPLAVCSPLITFVLTRSSPWNFGPGSEATSSRFTRHACLKRRTQRVDYAYGGKMFFIPYVRAECFAARVQREFVEIIHGHFWSREKNSIMALFFFQLLANYCLFCFLACKRSRRREFLGTWNKYFSGVSVEEWWENLVIVEASASWLLNSFEQENIRKQMLSRCAKRCSIACLMRCRHLQLAWLMWAGWRGSRTLRMSLSGMQSTLWLRYERLVACAM
jgi:hypothetical protein